MRRPRMRTACPADAYSAAGERIAEFSFPGGIPAPPGGLPGGLLSLRYSADAAPVVELYSLTGVRVRAPLAALDTPELDALRVYVTRLERAARALLDATENPADWQAPYTRQLSQTLAGEPTDELPDEGATADCENCGETVTIDGNDADVTTTWQQWECPHCTSWNDREA